MGPLAGEESTAASMIEDAATRVESLTPVEVAAALDGETLLVDVREADERAAHGAIPGSLPAPRGVIEFWADLESPLHHVEFEPDRRLILYSGRGRRSVLAADTLRRMGYRRVAHLDGGLEAWKDSGRPLEP